MYKGTIRDFNQDNGTGTIMREDGKIFSFNSSSVIEKDNKRLSECDTVFFDIGWSIKGLTAGYVLMQ